MLKIIQSIAYLKQYTYLCIVYKTSINLLIVTIMACGGKKGGGKRPPKK